MFYVFDLDGTLTDGDHRLHHIQKEPKDWDAYNAACVDDTPILPITELADIVRIADEQGLNIRAEIWTGRTDDQRENTYNWLAQNAPSLHHLPLRMRRKGDYRNSRVVKMEWARQHGRPYLVFEDRPTEAEWWLKEGIPVLLLQRPTISTTE